MSRRPKKRNKPYRGDDATTSTPQVQRYTAVVRSPLNQWWFDNKRRVKVTSIISLVVLVVGYLVYELLNLVF